MSTDLTGQHVGTRGGGHVAVTSGAFAAAAALVLLSLCPDVVLSTAFTPLDPAVASDLGTSMTGVQLAGGLANAGYAFGAVAAAQIALRLVPRRLFLGSALVFVVGAVVSAIAPEIVSFSAGRVLQGLATGGMLVSALPLLLTRFGLRRLPASTGIVNVGLFGASALGPIVGGLSADHWHWRGLFWVAAGLVALALLIGVVAFPTFAPSDPDRPVDAVALTIVVVATLATFTATSLLSGASFVSWEVLAPLTAGLLALVLLVVVEARRDDPLVPVQRLTTQLPITGLLAAMVGGAVFVAASELLQTQLTTVAGRSATSVGLLFWPAPVAALVTAVALRVLFPTRWLPLLVVGGLASLTGACVLLLVYGTDPPTGVVLAVTALLGLGAGGAVSPGIFLVALGLPSSLLGRALAMVQLLRATATYAVAPVLIHVAMSDADPTHGIHHAVVATLALAAAGLVASLVVPAVSGARLRTPDLAGWLDGGQGLPSPRTAVRLIPGGDDDDAAPLLPGGGHSD